MNHTHRKLHWRPIGIEQQIQSLYRCAERARESAERASEREKFTHWMVRLQEIRRAIVVIRRTVRSRVKDDTGLDLGGELLIIALFQPSTKNLFNEMRVHFQAKGGCDVDAAALQDLADLPERARVLAWIGDAAINLAVLEEIWDPRVAEVGILTERRSEYVQNANLARLTDRWGLFEHRIHFDPTPDPALLTEETLIRVKGTLAEAIFGVLFLSGGLAVVTRLVHLLRPSGS